jgi:hypothetical protein
MLVGIVGFINSGKGTVGDYLVSEYGFKQDSFARSLKDGVATVFGWDRKMLEGITPESRSWREAPDKFWSSICGIELSPRLALQLYGTECMRTVFSDDIWAAAVIKRWNDSGQPDTVITDCRFKNESEQIKNNDGYVIRVKRGEEPDWYDDYFQLMENNSWFEISQFRSAGVFPHISETDWIGLDFDHVLTNDGTLNELYFKIKEIINKIRP